MLRALLVFALAVLMAAPADAQRRDRHRSAQDGFAQKGDVALAFSIDGLNLQPFEGGIGARFWVSDRTVLATSVGFSVFSSDNNQTQWGTQFALGAERHFAGSRRVSPFLGLGASVGYAELSYNDFVYIEYDLPCDGLDCTVSYPFSSSSRRTSIGVAGFLGAEVKLTEGLTLAAAHRLGVEYTRDTRDRIIYDLPPDCPDCFTPAFDESFDRISVGTGTSSLTLSIYL